MNNAGPKGGMRRLLDVVFGLLVASATAATVISLCEGDVRIFPLILWGAVIFGAIFGLPVYAITHEHKRDSPQLAALTGLLIAALPIGLGTLIDVAADGRLSGIWQELATFSFGGVCAGLMFWIIVKWPAVSSMGSAWHRTGLNGLLAAGMIGATYFLPYPPADSSCHNPVRDGRTSIGVSAQFDLHVGMDQWTAVAEEMGAFGRSGHWSVQRDVRPDEGFPWFQISLCKEPGTKIEAEKFLDSTISIFVFQPQGGLEWQVAFGALYRRMDARWPGKISFTDNRGNATTVPGWARDKVAPTNVGTP